MSAKIIDGNAVAKKIREELKLEVAKFTEEGISIGLAVVIVGNNPASRAYVNMKKKNCEEIGIQSFEYALPEETTENDLLELISKLNHAPEINGILVQLPLPKQIDEDKVIEAIDPKKDVDCFHPYNIGRMLTGKPGFQPCTPSGVMELIKESGIDVTGKECVVLGRSNIVGKPQAIQLLAANGTITVCHSKTKNLEEVCRRADILVVAIGKMNFVKGSFIKPGAIVIDVGQNKDENGKMVGDVDYNQALEVAGAITPVPGGVGPMTRAILMKNTVAAVKNNW